MQVNVDHETKQLLMQWQAQDGVDASKTGLQDPPLLALEVEAAKAELTILKQIFADSKADAQAEEGSALLKSCVDSLARFESPQSMAFTNGHQVRLFHFVVDFACDIHEASKLFMDVPYLP